MPRGDRWSSTSWPDPAVTSATATRQAWRRHRPPVSVTGLAPGVTNGVNGLSISGGNSFDNLYTVNGAVVQENLRGQPHNLFIEDAIQETTVQTAGVSAEFGNFTGGGIWLVQAPPPPVRTASANGCQSAPGSGSQ